MTTQNWLQPTDDFIHRHLGPTHADIQEMLATLGLLSLNTLADSAIPSDLRFHRSLDIPTGDGEQSVLTRLKDIASQNKVYRSLIGMGYYDCVTPGVIQTKYSRKSCLVYAIHPIPSRNLTRPVRGAREFPDHGGRFDWSAAGECLAAG